MKNLVREPKRNILCIISAMLVTIYSDCNSHSASLSFQSSIKETPVLAVVRNISPVVDSRAVLNRPQVPILCYHQIRDWKATDSKRAEDYIVPVNNFREQMKLLADNGYHTILPDQLYDYLLNGASLPSRPIMLSFDDSRMEQFTIASEEMKKYGFKGVFFIMTVALNKPGYMSEAQVKQLADEGNIIGSHTWDHSNVKNYLASDWVKQIDKPSQELEKITGRPIEYFAYPFGLWNENAIEHLKERGFKAAFQLSERRDNNDPQFTIRRMIVPGAWSTATMQRWMKQDF